MPRFALLEHSGAPDDPAGLHWDLLLEAGDACRTWRLAAIPRPGGAAVPADGIAPHRLAWLDHEAGEVSGGRGFARRVDAGEFTLSDGCLTGDGPAGPLAVRLAGTTLAGTLVIASAGAGWSMRFAGGAQEADRRPS
ncbi:MAG: hypothetical protein ACKO3G_01395 [Planctomycetaceae bacterium]